MGIRLSSGRSSAVLAGAACVFAFALFPAVTHADTATCSYNAGAHTATVMLTAQPLSQGTSMGIRSSDGALLVQSGPAATPCGAATRTNLDTINVVSTNAASNGAIFRVATHGFEPGFTNEPGGSDEIEMSFDFSSGGRWTLAPDASGSSLPIDMALGGNQINFNRSETDGVDADATVTGAAEVFVYGSNAGDAILGNGGFGTTGGQFAIRMVVSSGPGPDLISGGRRADDLSGGLDADLIFGGRGRDSLKGLAGIDRLFGQAGNDKLLGGTGRDRLNGGAGRADACTSKHDRVRNCELPAKDKP